MIEYAMENPIGKVIKSYELRSLIGAGGFGAVYLAHQNIVERDVAVKIIYPAFANHPNFIRRFETEAQLIAGLEHPHIVPLYDYWREPDGAYLVMRWLRGGHLRDSLKDGGWSVSAASQLLNQVAAALTLAHRLGVVHRDIKPENILLDEDGNAYLADFGIAKILSNAQDTTDEFAAFGSPAYAAPEQVAGHVTTPQADIYSLGIVMYELLAGAHPFPDMASLSLTQLTSERISEPVPSILTVRGDLPVSIDRVIKRATELVPDARFPDVLSFARAFREAAASSLNTEGGRESISRRTVEMMQPDLPILQEVVINPYKGLRAFQETDAVNFFGRETLVQQLVNAMNRTRELSRFLAVVGPSGSGKSSVVKAGLIPALKRGAIVGSDRWFYVEMVPSAQPFKELQAALVSVATNPPDQLLERLRGDVRGILGVVEQILPEDKTTELFLFIDQFEEVFTLIDNEEEASRFLRTIHAAVTEPGSRIRIVITLRADFYDRPLLHPHMSELMRKRTEVVVPLNAEELERAITEPAHHAGVMLEPGLVNAIISEVTEQPGALPLLQYLLSELFERRERNTLTVNSYRAMGGVRGALARRADELFTSLVPEQREAARQLFLRLITLGEGTEDTRRRALLTEVTSMENGSVVKEVIDALGKARLLTFDRDPITRSPTVEVTHEAIIREWTQLRNWLDDSRSDIRLQRGLSATTDDWQGSNRDASFLLRGARLEQYEKWADSTNIALTLYEQEFLKTSIAERQMRETQERARQQRETVLERRARGRLRTLVAVLSAAALVATFLTVLALSASRSADEERDNANVARSTSDANASLSQSLALEASARQALSEDNGDLAIVLALEANRIPNPPAQAQRALSEVAFNPGTRRVIGDYAAWVTEVDLSVDGSRLLAGSTDSTVRLWDTTNGTEIRRFVGHRGDVESVALSSDGRRAMSGALDYNGILWDVESGAALFTLTGHTDPVRTVDFSPDDRYALTASSDGTLIIWDVASGQRVHQLVGHEFSVLSAAFSPDGRSILSGAENGRLILWNVETGERVRDFIGHTSSALDVAFRPDGLQAVSGSTDTTLIVWDVTTGQSLQTITGSGGAVNTVGYSPDGRTIFAGTLDGVLHIYDATTGERLNNLRGHTDSLLSLAISANGAVGATGSRDARIRLWNLNDARQEQRYEGHTQRILDLTFNADGTQIYTVAGDSSLRVWDRATGTQQTNVSLNGQQARSLVLTAAGDTALLGFNNGDIGVWNLATGTETTRYGLHTEAVLTLSLLPNGTQVLSGSQDGTLDLWNAATGEEIRRLTGHSGTVFSAAVSDDGRHALSSSTDGEIIYWDLESGTELRRLVGHVNSVFSVDISPDGRLGISGARDNAVIVWNLETGREGSRLLGHTDAVWSVTFDATGARAFSGSVDGSVIVWDVERSVELQRLNNLGAPVYRVVNSPEGSSALVGQEFGRVGLWRLFALEEMMTWTMENRYVRDLTCAERDLYRVPPLCPADIAAAP